MGSHLHSHKVLVIPEVSFEVMLESDQDDSCAKNLTDDYSTDCEGIVIDDIVRELNSMELSSSIFHEDTREEVSSIDPSLAIEILGQLNIKEWWVDAMCYFQFDFDGIASVLSRKVSTTLIADYVYKFIWRKSFD